MDYGRIGRKHNFFLNWIKVEEILNLFAKNSKKSMHIIHGSCFLGFWDPKLDVCKWKVGDML